MTRNRRQRSLFVAVALFGLGWWTRAVPLWWSPLPATLDGFVYARAARETLARGSIPLAGFRADALGSTALSSAAAAVTGVRPLLLLQPLYALIGGATVLLGFVFVRRLGRRRGWHASTIRRGAVLSGLVLATEGIFLRRSGVPDDDAITLLLIPLVTLVAAAYLRSGRRAWLGVLVPFLAVFPLVHTFSTFLLALTLLAVGALVVSARTGVAQPHPGTVETRGPSGVSLVTTAGVVLGFWVYFVTYYTLVERTTLSVPYVDRVSGHLGLFVGWTVVLLIGVVWFRQLRSRTRRLVATTPLALSLGVVVVNAQQTVFPETARTPRVVLFTLLPLALLAVVGAWGSPLLGDRDAGSVALLASFAAPVVTVLFSLSASLTPEFFGTVMRAQTHFHLPVAVVGAGWLARLVQSRLDTTHGDEPTRRRRAVVSGAVGLLVVGFVVATVATVPVAYVNLDTGSAPSTSMESEFAAATFAADHLPGGWTSSHTQVRIAGNYYRDAGGEVAPTRRWLRGGALPNRPVFTQTSWTTTGAHLFPLGPELLSEERLDRVHARNDVVYTAGGYDPVTGVRPRPTTRQ